MLILVLGFYLILRMYAPMFRNLNSLKKGLSKSNKHPSRKLGFPSIMNINKINEPIESLADKIEDLSYPKKENGEKYDDDELGVDIQKQTSDFVDLRRKVYGMMGKVTKAENKLYDLELKIKTNSGKLGDVIHEINMIS